MDIIKDTDFTDERSLFQGKNLQIDNCTFQVGESPLKESENIDIKNSKKAIKINFRSIFNNKSTMLLKSLRSTKNITKQVISINIIVFFLTSFNIFIF